jgi:hypothetical protein
MSGQVHALATLLPGKEKFDYTDQGIVWAPEWVWTFSKNIKSPAPRRESNQDSSVAIFIAYSLGVYQLSYP